MALLDDLVNTFIGAGASTRAASDQRNAQQQAMALEQNAADYTKGLIAPIYDQGLAANRELGLLTFGYTPGAGGTTDETQVNWSKYLQDNPDVMAQYSSLSPNYLKTLGITTPQQFAQYHYNNNGKGEGRAISYMDGTTPGQAQTGGRTQADALKTFESSPYYTAMSTQLPYQENALSRAMAARGLNRSGAAITGLQDLEARQGMNALNSYISSLSSQAGYTLPAASTAGNAATGAANANANALTNIGKANANGTISSANAWQQGTTNIVNDLAKIYAGG